MAAHPSSQTGPIVHSAEDIARMITSEESNSAAAQQASDPPPPPAVPHTANARPIRVARRCFLWLAILESLGLLVMVALVFQSKEFQAKEYPLVSLIVMFILPGMLVEFFGLIWVSYGSQIFLLNLLDRRRMPALASIPLSIIGGPALALALLRVALTIIGFIRGI